MISPRFSPRSLKEANDALSALGIHARIEQRRQQYVLRATLPPKPGSQKTTPYQQRVSIGAFANSHGLTQAIARAQQLSYALENGDFKWSDWSSDRLTPTTNRDRLKDFELDYFQKRGRTITSSRTFDKEYFAVLSRLDPTAAPCCESLKRLILTTAPDTRSRVRFCLAASRFARFCGLDCDFHEYRGAYSPHKVAPRNLPSDSLIEASIDAIADRKWRQAIAMIACYGVRPSELVTIAGKRPVCRVTSGKTGARDILPIYPHWFDRWNLGDRVLPEIAGRDHCEVGTNISKKFKRLGLPFRPYDLRHAYARRCFEQGISTTIAADLMGHDVRTHQKIYRRWIQADTYERLYQRLSQA